MEFLFWLISILLGLIVIRLVMLAVIAFNSYLEYRRDLKAAKEHRKFNETYIARRFAVEAKHSSQFAQELISMGYRPAFDDAKKAIFFWQRGDQSTEAYIPTYAYTVYKLLDLLRLPVELVPDGKAVRLTEQVSEEHLADAMRILCAKETIDE